MACPLFFPETAGVNGAILSFLFKPRSPPLQLFYSWIHETDFSPQNTHEGQSYSSQHPYIPPKQWAVSLDPRSKDKRQERKARWGRDTCVQEARWVVDTARGCRPMAGESRGRSPDLLRRRPLKGIRSRFPVHCMFMTCNQTGWEAGKGSFSPQAPKAPVPKGQS